MRTMFAGWWTWWHIFPSLAIANFLEWEKLFLISKNNLDEEILKKTNFKYKKISSWKLRRYFSWENFTDFFKFIFWIFQSLKIIKKFNPDAVFCKWGFVSLPVAIAGKILWKKIILHESDAVMWFSNKIIAKFAKKIFYWEKIWNPINFYWKKFSESEKKKFIQEKIFPLVKKNFPNIEKNFLENKKILLISWGSQGSLEINNLIEKNFSEIEKNFFVIHLTWKWKKLKLKIKIICNLNFWVEMNIFIFYKLQIYLFQGQELAQLQKFYFFKNPRFWFHWFEVLASINWKIRKK